MPELPEVETIRRGLEKRSAGHAIVDIQGRDGRLFRHNPDGLATVRTHLSGRTILGIERRGKFMWIRFADSPQALVVHLGMSGQVRAETAEHHAVPRNKHEHLRLILDDDTALSFVDPRTFGHLTLSAVSQDGQREIPAALSHIAPDLLETAWSLTDTITRARASGRRVKTILLDQGIVSGVGNIYADEGLYRARTHGFFRGRDLGDERWALLLSSCAAAMAEAVEVGGTSFDSLYVDVEGNPGYFGRTLAVYGRAGEPCVQCLRPIERAVLDGRSHFYCRTCQLVGADGDQSV